LPNTEIIDVDAIKPPTIAPEVSDNSCSESSEPIANTTSQTETSSAKPNTPDMVFIFLFRLRSAILLQRFIFRHSVAQCGLSA
jgi:hypothetical protein